MKVQVNLRTLIPLLCVVVALILICIDYLVISQRVVSRETNQFLSETRFLSTYVQGTLNRAIRRHDIAEIQQSLLDMNMMPSMREAYLIDDTQTVIYATNLSDVSKPVSALDFATYIELHGLSNSSDNRVTLIDESNLIISGFTIEALQLDDKNSLRPRHWKLIAVFDFRERLSDLQSEVRDAVLLNGSIVFGVILLFSVFLHLFISNRLNSLLQFISEYSTGQKKRRPALTGADELAKINRAIERLIVDIEDKQEKLERSRYSLKALNEELSSHKLALDKHCIVSVTDESGTITYVNELFCSVSGYTPEELIGKTHRLINSGEHDEAFFADLWGTISAGKLWRGQLKNRKKDGSFYWVQSTIVPIMDPKTSSYRYIAIRTDITAEKELSRSLLGTQMKNKQMYGIIAHELRTPAAAIEMMTDTDTQEWIENKDQVLKAITGLLHSIDEMKILVNPELEREIHLEVVTVNELNTSIHHMVASALTINATKFTQVTTLPDQLETTPFTTDPYRLKACVTNLIRNACLHSEGKEVCSLTETFTDSNGNMMLRWVITDDGKGIPPSQEQTLFKPFVRGDSQAEGTGLGLYIAKSWIEEIGGELRFERPEKGSKFIISLPINPPEFAEKSEQAVPLVDNIDQLAKEMRVLYVEDDLVLQAVTKKALGPLFASFDIAKDGAEGLEKAKEHYDLILTDYFMPIKTGLEMTKELRDAGDMRPIISVTAATIGKESEDLTRAGVDIVLSKPLKKEAILRSISDLYYRGRIKASNSKS